MAYQNLGNIAWGSGPNITGTIAYDYQRSGADMQYKVKITVNSVSGASYFGYPIYTSLRLDGTSKVSGHQIKAASPSQWTAALVYETDWLTVSGKSSGTTALSVNIYSGSGESRDYTYSYSLYVVPAASTMIIPAITLGSVATLKITPAVSGYTHTIKYKFGSASGTVGSEKTSNTSVSWTPAITLAQQIPNAASGTGTLTLETYSGTTKIGSRDYTFTATVPASVKPAVSSVVLSDEGGYLTTFGDYVQGKSQLRLKATATQAHGSPIKSYTFIVDGKTSALASAETTVDLLNAGTIPVVVRVTDGRGRVSADYSTTITVLPYAAPQISALGVSRCKSDGTLDAAGSYALVVFSGSISPLNNINAATWRVQYRKESVESWTDASFTVSSKYSPLNAQKIVSGIVANSPYVFRISATDTVTGTVYSVEVPIPSGYAFLRTNAELNGLSLGKEEVKENALCVAWDMEIDGNLKVGGTLTVDGETPEEIAARTMPTAIADYIVEQGTSGIWTYRKWNSGAAECWGNQSFTTAVSTASGGGYRSSMQTPASFPANLFISAPVVTDSVNGTSDYFVIMGHAYSATKNNMGAFYLWRPTSAASIACDLHMHAIGRWK